MTEDAERARGGHAADLIVGEVGEPQVPVRADGDLVDLVPGS